MPSKDCTIITPFLFKNWKGNSKYNISEISVDLCQETVIKCWAAKTFMPAKTISNALESLLNGF